MSITKNKIIGDVSSNYFVIINKNEDKALIFIARVQTGVYENV